MAFTAGQKLKASNLGQLSSTAQYAMAADQTLTTSTDTIVAFGTAAITSTMVTRAVSGVGHEFTLNSEGIWIITVGGIQFDANATGGRNAHLKIVGGVRLSTGEGGATASHPNTYTLSACRYFAAGTKIICEAWQSSGGDLDINAVAAFGIGVIDFVRVLG